MKNELVKLIVNIQAMIANDAPLVGVHREAWEDSWNKQLIELHKEYVALDLADLQA